MGITLKETGIYLIRVWNSRLTTIGSYELSVSLPDTTLNVSTTTDVVANDGVCSLREAITAAYTLEPSGSANGECSVNIPNSTIVVPAGTYKLTIKGSGDDTNVTGDLDIRGEVSIQGASASTTIIDATGLGERVIDIWDSASTTLSNLTITGGQSFETGVLVPAGGILNDGDLTIVDSVIKGNTGLDGGGIWNRGPNLDPGTITISGSLINANSATRNGGGVFNFAPGSMTIDNSTISGNFAVAGSGGGIVQDSANGTVTINNSTIANNQAQSGSLAFGGGISIDEGSVFLTGISQMD